MRAVCIVSGGMDSALALALTINGGSEPIAVHFDYNQRTMRKEKAAFRALCDHYKIAKRYEIDLGFFGAIGASALTDMSISVPSTPNEPNSQNAQDTLSAQNTPSTLITLSSPCAENSQNSPNEPTEPTEPNPPNPPVSSVPITYVPFRNGIFLSVAAAIAEKEGAGEIVIGAVEEDSSGYPDCRERFLDALASAINLGTKDETRIVISAPLVHLSKREIVQTAAKLGVPLKLTWSCYQDEEAACGVCESCRLRLKGFRLAKIADEIRYRQSGTDLTHEP